MAACRTFWIPTQWVNISLDVAHIVRARRLPSNSRGVHFLFEAT